MNLEMYLGEVEHQKSGMNNQHVELIQAMEQLIQSIDQFSRDILLRGKAYDSAKQYFSLTYKTLAQGLICLSEELIRINDAFPTNYRSEVASIDLNEAEIEEQIRQIKHNLGLLSELTFKSPIALKSMEQMLTSMKSKLEERLDKLRQFEYDSSRMYNTAMDLANNIVKGLVEVQNGKGWNAGTGSFDFSKVNMDWVFPIQNSFAERAKKQETNGETYDFSEYQFNLLDDGTYMLWKSGNTPQENARATLAYYEALKAGKIEAGNGEDPNSLVNIYMRNLLVGKTGINPYTGETVPESERWKYVYAGTMGLGSDVYLFLWSANIYSKGTVSSLLDDGVSEADRLKKININDFEIKNKHLLESAAKRARKFNVSTPEEANKIVQEAISNGKIYEVIDNGVGSQGQQSFSAIIDTGKVIGTKGEIHIKIVYDELNNVWTTYPVPKP